MDTLSTLLVNNVTTYGAPLLGLILLLGALGLPIPSSFLLVTVGVISRQGLLDGFSAAALGLLGTVIGDSLSFALGRWSGTWTLNYFGRAAGWTKATAAFQRGSGLAVFVTRFLLTAIATPVNLIAGGSGYAFRHFIMVDALGEFIWVMLYGSLGYFFGSQWDVISQSMTNVGMIVTVLAAAVAGLYLWRTRVKQKMVLAV